MAKTVEEIGSLTISRRKGEVIQIGEITVTVTRIAGNRVRLRVTAPTSVSVHRQEILLAADKGQDATQGRQDAA